MISHMLFIFLNYFIPIMYISICALNIINHAYIINNKTKSITVLLSADKVSKDNIKKLIILLHEKIISNKKRCYKHLFLVNNNIKVIDILIFYMFAFVKKYYNI